VRRSLALAILATVSACLLTACGGGSSSTATPTDSTDTASASPSPTRTPSATEPLTSPGTNDVIVNAVPLVEALRPSVVHILSETTSFDFFGQFTQQGVGTGIILDTDGHIATNNHVITDENTGNPASKITVTLADGREETATIVGRDTPTDLAVIQIQADNLTPARLGASADLKVGQEVIAIGNALDLPGGPTVSKGLISALGRLIQEDPYTIPDAIQTDASINPGNSGGPLVNASGEVVGITTAVIRGDQSDTVAEGIGLAISIDSAKPIFQDLIQDGKVQRAVLGIASLTPITPAIQSQFSLPVSSGIGINTLQQGSPADLAGLREGDIIVAMDGKTTDNTGQFFAILAAHRKGDQISVDYYRGSQKLSVQVTLG